MARYIRQRLFPNVELQILRFRIRVLQFPWTQTYTKLASSEKLNSMKRVNNQTVGILSATPHRLWSYIILLKHHRKTNGKATAGMTLPVPHFLFSPMLFDPNMLPHCIKKRYDHIDIKRCSIWACHCSCLLIDLEAKSSKQTKKLRKLQYLFIALFSCE